MEWSKGYSASYYGALVDPGTWRDTGRFRILSGSISRQSDGLMESADLQLDRYPDGIESWIRIYMDVRQSSGASAHVPLFTGLATSPERAFTGAREAHAAMCYSVLKPADDIRLPRGWYALAGRSGAELVQELLAVGPAPVIYDAVSPVLSETVIAENGETNLSMAQKVLGAMSWRLRISGDGMITICPRPTEPSARFSASENDCIELQVTTGRDLFSCPNVFRAVLGDLSATAYDEDPASILSTVSRGREVWAEELSPAMADNESLMSYARRRLAELQQVASVASYKRRYNPDVLAGDLVELDYPDRGLTGTYTVMSQGITLGYNGQTAETVTKGGSIT